MSKMRVVHYLNQFFGQIGGEEKANEGFSVKEGPVGPGIILQKELGDTAEIVATVICGDDFFAVNPAENAEIGLEKLAPFKPDMFFAGPAFAAGRYTIACGAMCKKVSEKLQIPVISAMNEEAPGTDIYRKDAFIVKTGIHSKEMANTVKDMVRLAARLTSSGGGGKLLTFEDIPDPGEYNYFSRNMLRNYLCEETVAQRGVASLLKKLKGEPFTSEVIPPVFEIFEIPAAIKDMSHAEIAFVTDGGLVPKGNPDGMATRSNLRWGAYDLEKLFNDYEVVHAGYFNDYVIEDPDRLVPRDVLNDLVGEGKVGAVADKLYSMPACTTVSKRCAEAGTEMAEAMKARGHVDGVILTSTWGTSTRCGATIARSIEKMGIPVVQITAIPDVAKMLSVSRIVVGKAVPHPTGDVKLDKEKEKALRRKYVLKALELLKTDVSEPTIAVVES